jgi:large subunit ribosomal protein L13
MKTTVLKSSQIKRNWYKIDLKDQILGRVATQIAFHLMGKNKPLTSPNLDSGDFVVALNASDIKVTGKKLDQKMYQRHSGHPGGFRELTLKQVMAKDPRKVIEQAVKGMLPKNKLRTPRMRRLKVYLSTTHPYEAQVEPKVKKSKETKEVTKVKVTKTVKVETKVKAKEIKTVETKVIKPKKK